MNKLSLMKKPIKIFAATLLLGWASFVAASLPRKPFDPNEPVPWPLTAAGRTEVVTLLKSFAEEANAFAEAEADPATASYFSGKAEGLTMAAQIVAKHNAPTVSDAVPNRNRSR
jgi:hypothetical protein